MKKIFFIFLIIFSFSFAKNYKLIETNTLKNLKYSTKVIVEFDENQVPSEEKFDKIGSEIIENNPGYKTYFINYYYPKMNINSTNVANTIKRDGEQKTEILLWALEYDPYYSKYVAYNDEGNLYWCGVQTLEKVEENLEEDENEWTPFRVEFTPQIKLDKDLGVKVIIKTNLPEWTMINISIEPNIYSDTFYVNSDGSVETFFINVEDGSYLLSVVSIAEPVQEDENVRKIMGEDGKNMLGKYIKKDIMGSFLEYEKIFKVKRNY